MKLEKRIFTVAKMTVREMEPDGDEPMSGSMMLEGYASVFNRDSLDLGDCVETVAATAFDRTLKENPDVCALWNHDTSEPLARTTSGTLKLSTDTTGLKVGINLPKTGRGPFLKEMVERGDITGMSFGFIVRKDKWDFSSTPNRREILDLDLYEVSPCTFPAYPDTSIDMASRELITRSKEQAQTISADQKAKELNDFNETISRRLRLANI